jgi:nicotinamide mononucleotide (NMN) deamidase PncC
MSESVGDNISEALGDFVGISKNVKAAILAYRNETQEFRTTVRSRPDRGFFVAEVRCIVSA